MTLRNGGVCAMLLTRSFHKRKDVATASSRQRSSNMLRATRLTLAGLLVLALGACATQQPDLTAPPAKRLDAKTTLESGPRR